MHPCNKDNNNKKPFKVNETTARMNEENENREKGPNHHNIITI